MIEEKVSTSFSSVLEVESQTLRNCQYPSSSSTSQDASPEEDDLWYLEVLFALSFLPSKRYSSRGWLYLNTFSCIYSSFVGYGMALFILMVRVLTEGIVTQLFSCAWVFTMSTVYLVLSFYQRQSPDLIEKLRMTSRPGTHPLLQGIEAPNFTSVCKWPVIIVVVVWLLNLGFTTINTRSVITANFGLSDNIFYILFVALNNFHVHLLVWFIPLPIICVGCHYLSAKMEMVHKVFSVEFAKENPNVVSLADLYMEMYELNHILNDAVSLVFTFVVAMNSFVFLFVILAYIVDSGQFPLSLVFLWSVLNLCLLAPICISAALLEIWNKKFLYLLGEIPLRKDTSTVTMLQYSTLRSKVISCRLGVRLYKTLIEVSFSKLSTTVSVWLSVFLFVGGLVRLNDLSQR